MKKIALLFSIALLAGPMLAFAEPTVVEGDDAAKLYQADKGKALSLVQKNKEFLLRTADGKETLKPEIVTVKVGQRLYILNEEMTFVHNVYDETDANWVLKKQEPSKVAVITFDKPGNHILRCAIHPTMKTELHVVP
jgi:plastocyanin